MNATCRKVPAYAACHACSPDWYLTATGTTGPDLAELKDDARAHSQALRHRVDIVISQEITFEPEQPVLGHGFVRPGQVAPDLPPPDNCMRCGQPEAAHPARPSGTESEPRS